MSLLNSGRIRQTYILLVTCVAFFALLLLVLPGMSIRLWLWVMGAALVANVVCVVLFTVWLSRLFPRRDSPIPALHHITAGNLDLAAKASPNPTESTRMPAPMPALVANLERT